jgi:hypothetical protein|tara:strand:+ start:1370 stop:1504 length:135 start_codon:yes stop_codon:yes gene_type:complete
VVLALREYNLGEIDLMLIVALILPKSNNNHELFPSLEGIEGWVN